MLDEPTESAAERGMHCLRPVGVIWCRVAPVAGEEYSVTGEGADHATEQPLEVVAVVRDLAEDHEVERAIGPIVGDPSLIDADLLQS